MLLVLLLLLLRSRQHLYFLPESLEGGHSSKCLWRVRTQQQQPSEFCAEAKKKNFFVFNCVSLAIACDVFVVVLC
jgi:hypothetical protein